MPDPQGEKLFVNLAASQARLRLKGFGHGVRKVRSAGRDRALILHTATGRHLAELEARFADVGLAHVERELEAAVASRAQQVADARQIEPDAAHSGDAD